MDRLHSAVESADQAIDATGEETVQVQRPGEFSPRPVDDEWGHSESIDPDNVGDIADEGAGHRG
jgi:hypothetical protein